MKKISLLLFWPGLFLALLFIGVWSSAPVGARPPVQQTGSELGITLTVGTVPGRCESTTIIAVPSNTSAYFCLQIRNNTTDTTFTRHIIQYPGNITDTLNLELGPGQAIALTDNILESYGLPPRLSLANVTQKSEKIIVVYSTNGTVTVGSTQAKATVIIGNLAMSVKKTVGVEPAKCASTTAIAVASGTRVYYCITVANQGNLRIAKVAVHDPPLNHFNETLGRSVISVSNASAFVFPAYTATQNLTNTMIVTGFSDEGATTSQQATARLLIGQAQLQVKLTTESSPGSCIGSSNGSVPLVNTLIYYCITLENNGNFPLMRHTINARDFKVVNLLTLTQTIQAGGKLEITEDFLRSLGMSTKLTQTVTTTVTKSVNVTSTNEVGLVVKGRGEATVGLGTPKVSILVNVSDKQNHCVPDKTVIDVAIGAPYYYCIYITNIGTVPLIRHRLVESVSPGVRTVFTYTLEPVGQSKKITLTNKFFTETLQLKPALGPFTATALSNGNHTIYLTSTSSTGALAPLAQQGVTVRVPQVSPTPTKAPTQPPTPIPPTPTTTPTLTPTWTPTPTLTATSVFVSMLPLPTSNLVNAVQTPTPVATSPLAPPVDPALFTPTPDFNATFAMQSFEATAAQVTAEFFATQNALTLATPTPLETPTPQAPTEAPTPTPSLIVITQENAAATALSPTQPPSPLAAPPAAPGQDYAAFLGRVMGVSLVAFGWIWFLVGTVVFFAAAGIFVGFGIRGKTRRRYQLEESPEFGLTNELPASNVPISSQRPTRSANADDNWPASLP